MECPICKKAMLEGYIPAGRGALEWYGDRTVRLTKTSFWGAEEAKSFYCPDCRHILIPVPEIESFSDKVFKKLDDTVKNIQSSVDELDRRRTEKRNQRESEKRGRKDPWEM